MKIRELLEVSKSDNKYDVAIRMCYLIFYAIGIIVFFSVGLQHMTLWIWGLAFVCCALGATVYGTVAKIIITLIRKDLENGKKVKPDLVVKLSYLVIFSIATMIFVSTGIEHGTAKIWLLSFIASYGGAVIYSAIVRLIVTLVRKDK